MASDFDFNLDDIPVPGANRRPRGLLRLPVPDDGPPGTSDVPLIRDKSPKNVSTSEFPDGLKNNSRDCESLFTPTEDDQKQMKFSFSKSSVLGSELAKKRLQAFCLQKKQSNTSPTSLKPAANTILTSPVLFGNKFQSALKKMPTISKTNPLEECAEKAKNLPKKIYKKVTEYEKSRTTMTEILELKKEEDRKLALIKLGVPLGLVPGNAPVKGLTPKPMPTKAMPPIKNFLDPQQVESLLKKADLLVNSDDPSFKFSLTDDKLFDNKYKPNRRSHDRNNRSNKNRYSDHYRKNDRRRDRDRDRDRRRHDSHSRSKHRDSSGGRDKHKRHDSISKPMHEEVKKPVNIVEDKKEDIMDNSEFYMSNDTIEKSSENVQIDANNFNHFSIESLNEISDEKKCEVNVEDDEIMPDFKVENKSQLIYDKFLKEKFVPFPSVNFIRKDDDLDFDCSPKVSPDLASKSFEDNKIDLYSPGIESSRESTPLLNKFAPIPQIIPPEDIKQMNNKKLDIYECWSNINKVCIPRKHSSPSCFRKTLCHPSLTYSENTLACICNSARREGLEVLASNIDSLLSSMEIENSNNVDHSTQNWYPRSNEVFQDVPKLSTALHSNWETDDSLSRPSETMHKNDRSESESNSVNKPTLNFKDLDIFSNNSLPENNSTISNTLYDENCVSTPKDESKPPNSSLVSEYEKFMEAVCPQIGDEGNNSYRSDSHSITQDITMENSSNSKMSSFDLMNSDDLYENKEISQKSDEQMFTEDERLEYFNIEKGETNDVAKSDDSTIPSPDVAKNVTTYLKTGEECWSSENSSDVRKTGKYSPDYSSSKSVSKRKGHAKISSRRHKKKSKSHKNRHKSSSSSSATSSSDSSSNSSSSSSSNSVNSDSSETSSSKSSSDSSSASDSSSDSDTSTSDSSISSDEKLIKSKKKIEKKILARAKKLVKKAKRKKLRKMKKLIAQEKKEMHVPKEIMNEFDLKDDNVLDIIEKNIHVDVSKKSKKRKLKDKKNKSKHKKRKHTSPNELTSSSSDSEKSVIGVESRMKRSLDIVTEDSHDYFLDPKKKKNSLENSANDSFDMNTLLNIKNEKVSDEEDSLCKKPKESESKKSPYKQLIINACELQNSFLEGNKNNDFNKAVVKTESCHGSIESSNKIDATIQDEKISLPDENMSNLESKETDEMDPAEINDIYSLTKLDNLDDNLVNPTILDVNNRTFENDTNDVNSQIDKNEIASIETVQNDRRPDNPVKVRKERKASRWGSVNDREFVPQNNSTLIEVPIQEFDKTNFDNNLHSYNVNEDVEMDTDENKVYKIPTISSRNVISPKAFAVNQSNYDNYPVFDDHKVEQDPMVNSVDFDGKKSPTRKISLDDRINMALLFQSDETMEKSITNIKTPDKGILIVGGSRLTRADPRITRTKKVSFADGFAPGQDSDCENEPQNPKINQSSGNLSDKKKKKRSFSGHAYPCPETWPDYHPRWDRLPPPPPPPGSPPPELCDRTNFLLLNANTNSSPLSRIPRVLNAVAS